MNKIIDGKEISETIRKKLKNEIRDFMIKPCLAVIQVGDDAGSTSYIRGKERACTEVGIYFKHLKYDANVKEQELINKIKELNNDDYVDGILVQLPLPRMLNEQRILKFIASNKDVDGLTVANIGKLVNNEEGLVPCTPQAIIEMLNYSKVNIAGNHVVIVGRSKLVGKPLISLFLNKDATVTVCHSKTVDLEKYTKQADILVVAVGKKHLITKSMVKEKAIVIDVGINRENDKLYGDVDFDNVLDKVSLITPVPGGVGPMTVAILLKNVLESYKKKSITNQ